MPRIAVHLLILAATLASACTPSGDGPSSAPEGRVLLGEQGCLSCHAMQGQGGNMGPELGSELAARGEETLFAYLRDPKNINVYPGNGHDAFTALSEAQAREIARYLSGLTVSSHYQGPAPPRPPQ